MCRNVLLKFFLNFWGVLQNSFMILRNFYYKIYYTEHLVKSAFVINPFSTNAPFVNKPGSWFLLAKYVKNTCGIKTF